ncbi:D-lactate dehydrogenase [Moritella viscosa]|uniref:D-lactate dehydrogenase n=1 Tax=Moritella viscosa TaxID=80854 RepID=A0A090IBE4_9GAMM|nr:D-2-hydroxyacid dehydrogenase [Moritella viscosa]CED59390.1 2-hydroxyacid dehydrogenase [Moritella viscosa]SGY87404.1 D-lactate dehydrogenase [Moritella viscosa]SGY87419.1 D-lactate dehydrogenase [Moritella viscosa]SGY88975.1 D-lactate dehydrogenase [Moritella viscosa]SHO01377.1 D-lactate dehydrogenase [Moritella viscosa]
MDTIVFLDRSTIPEHITIPKPDVDCQWHEYATTTSEQVIERLQDASIVITNKVILNTQVLSQCPQLKMIAVAATGTNNIDLGYCRQHNITVSNIQGYATNSVPEHVLAMMFALKRNLVGYHQDIQAGVWLQQKQFCFFSHPISDIAGSTIGIIGKGSLGNAVATLARALGMTVLFAERKGANECRKGYSPFEFVLQQADVLTLHCPLAEQTHNIIGSDEFKLMKSTSILINAGRGGLVDEVALVEALYSQQIAGAGVDVFTQEPADDNNPLIANAHLPNLILTPHVAWGSDSAIQTLSNQLIANINAFIAGTPQNQCS